MAKRKQDENLIPFTSDQSREEAKKNGAKGGRASGIARRRKADMRRLANDVLNGEYTMKNGEKITGYEIMLRGIMQNLSDVKSRNWGKSVDILMQLSGAYMTKEQVAKLKAETKLTQAKCKQMESGGSNADVEDLAPLAQLLMQEDPKAVTEDEEEGVENDENTDN